MIVDICSALACNLAPTIVVGIRRWDGSTIAFLRKHYDGRGHLLGPFIDVDPAAFYRLGYGKGERVFQELARLTTELASLEWRPESLAGDDELWNNEQPARPPRDAGGL